MTSYAAVSRRRYKGYQLKRDCHGGQKRLLLLGSCTTVKPRLALSDALGTGDFDVPRNQGERGTNSAHGDLIFADEPVDCERKRSTIAVPNGLTRFGVGFLRCSLKPACIPHSMLYGTNFTFFAIKIPVTITWC